jgi:hypothetical protein
VKDEFCPAVEGSEWLPGSFGEALLGSLEIHIDLCKIFPQCRFLKEEELACRHFIRDSCNCRGDVP